MRQSVRDNWTAFNKPLEGRLHFMYLDIKGSRFVRKDPASGFICNKGGIVNT